MTHSFTYCVSKPIITYSFFLNLALGVSLFYLKKSHTSSHKQIVATRKKMQNSASWNKVHNIHCELNYTAKTAAYIRIQAFGFLQKNNKSFTWKENTTSLKNCNEWLQSWRVCLILVLEIANGLSFIHSL